MFIYFPQFLNYRLFIHQYLLLTILSNRGNIKVLLIKKSKTFQNENLLN